MSRDTTQDNDVKLAALAVLGWILPFAGLVWGPGEWWAYVIWLVIGTALIVLYQLKS